MQFVRFLLRVLDDLIRLLVCIAQGVFLLCEDAACLADILGDRCSQIFQKRSELVCIDDAAIACIVEFGLRALLHQLFDLRKNAEDLHRLYTVCLYSVHTCLANLSRK